ncbi:HAD family hydrolase [Nanoarchaeota archaeon]
MITTIVVDWGGVINMVGHASSMSKQIQEKYDLPYMSIIEAIVPLWKKLNRNLVNFEELRVGLNEKLNLDISMKELTGYLNNSFKLNLEVIELLGKLKREYFLIMLSNNNDSLVNSIEKNHPEVFNLFEKHYFSSELDLRKPDERIFLHFLEDTKLNAKECLFIDDTEENIVACKKLGMKGIVYKDVDQLKRELAKLNITLDQND